MPNQYSDYIVFADESGDHSLDKINPIYPLFVLSFCIFPIQTYIHQITPAIRQLKFETFGHDQVILHERDIRKKKGHFSQLNELARNNFLQRLTTIISETDMTLIAVVIDKSKHKAKYVSPEHPYHLAMQFGLERVSHFLHLKAQAERETHIIFEARGMEEDRQLELEFHRVCSGANRSGQSLPLKIIMTDKKAQCEGLQLADLTARPTGLSVLYPTQPNRAWEILQTKLFAGPYNCVFGNGLKVFP